MGGYEGYRGGMLSFEVHKCHVCKQAGEGGTNVEARTATFDLERGEEQGEERDAATERPPPIRMLYDIHTQ